MTDKPKRRIKIEYDSPVILTVAILSFLILGLNAILSDIPNALIFSTYRSSFSDPLFYVRLFTHVLGHADFAHYFGNMSLLLIIGPVVEKRYGSIEMLVAVLFTALTEGAVHCLVSSDTALLGASGIVFMCIFLAAAQNIGDGKLSLTFVFVALIYFGEAVYTGIAANDSVSQLCHIVGGLCGIFVGYIMRRRHPRR